VEAILIILALAVVVWVVSAPLRHPVDPNLAPAGDRAGLEAAKEAKYREIRDAELDRQQGKLSEADWRRQDAELRREAIEILKRLDHLRGRRSAGD
jgi:hypothetical protein